MKKRIAILSGGDSSEYDISVKSAVQIMTWINRTLYDPILVTVKGNIWIANLAGGEEYQVDLRDFSIPSGSRNVRFDYAYIIIHGDPGENGKMQAYLEMQNIPYSTSGILSSALSFNKYACKMYLRNFGVLTPEAILIHKKAEIRYDLIIDKVGFPCFVKPNNGGSSFGTSKATRSEDLEKAINAAFSLDDEVIIESFVKGTELSCGILKTADEEIVFPVTEIIPKKEFFDYEAKYTDGMSEEITPARVSEDIQKKCRLITSEIYDLLKCRGIVRVDFILRGNQLYFLELNSVPGMSRESIVPKQIRAMGLTVEEVIEKVIQDTMGE
jgi:D-alanine-D-alanine ligase